MIAASAHHQPRGRSTASALLTAGMATGSAATSSRGERTVEDVPGHMPVFRDSMFHNPWPTFTFPKAKDLLRFLVLDKDNSGVPKKAVLDEVLPVVRPEFLPASRDGAPLPGVRPLGTLRVTWLGHAAVFVEMDGYNILTDPVFSRRCSPVQFAGPLRYRPPPATVEELPQVHAVFISHNHYDHLDVATVRGLSARFPDLQWFVPVGIKKWMVKTGRAAEARVTEMTWWETVTVDRSKGISCTFTPAQHWGKRTATDTCKALWGSWVVKGPRSNFFFGGDTGYCSVYKEIGDRHGPFSLAAIPIGAYEPRDFMRPQHVNPEEAVQIHQELRCRNSLGIHWGTWPLTYEPYVCAICAPIVPPSAPHMPLACARCR